jgi:hypothetical protein
MRAELARRAASIMSSSSMMFSAGAFVGCTMKTSFPRTFSSIRTKISPSANRVQVIRQRSMPSCRAISSASGRLPVPANSLNPCAGTASPSMQSLVK